MLKITSQQRTNLSKKASKPIEFDEETMNKIAELGEKIYDYRIRLEKELQYRDAYEIERGETYNRIHGWKGLGKEDNASFFSFIPIVHPYTQEKENVAIYVYTDDSRKYAFIYPFGEENLIFINLLTKIPRDDHYAICLYHELTHIVDPKRRLTAQWNRIYRARESKEKYLASPTEIDATINEIYALLFSSNQRKYLDAPEILQWIKENGPLDKIPALLDTGSYGLYDSIETWKKNPKLWRMFLKKLYYIVQKAIQSYRDNITQRSIQEENPEYTLV